MSTNKVDQALTHYSDRSEDKEALLYRSDFERIRMLGLELYKFWAFNTLSKLCISNVERKKEFLVEFEKSCLSLMDKLAAKRRSGLHTPQEIESLQEYHKALKDYPRNENSQAIDRWCAAYKETFLKLQKIPIFNDNATSFLKLLKYNQFYKSIEELNSESGELITRIKFIAKLVFHPPKDPLFGERKQIIESTVSFLFPYYFTFRDDVQLFKRMSDYFDPDASAWQGQIYSANAFGKIFKEERFGHQLEEVFFRVLRDNQAYYPVSVDLYQRTPDQVILPEEPIKIETPSPSSTDTTAADFSDLSLLSDVASELSDAIHPIIQSLAKGFKRLSVDERLLRWNSASFEVAPDPKVFPGYSADLETWKKDIVRHRLPFYLLLNLDADVLKNYGTKEGKTWKFSTRIVLPEQRPILGTAEVSVGDDKVIFHNYFMLDPENNIDAGLKKMKKFTPMDTFYDASLSTMVNDFRVKIMPDDAICIEDTKSGMTAFIKKSV